MKLLAEASTGIARIKAAKRAVDRTPEPRPSPTLKAMSTADQTG
jgi:hypothetical protein